MWGYLKRSWTKLPSVVRVVITGFAVLLAGILPWQGLVSVNLEVGSTFPWAFFVQLAYLALLWQYLQGKGWPRSTAQIRHQYLRANAVPPSHLVWAIIAGSLFVAALVGLQIVGWMLVRIPPAQLEEFAILESYPAWTVIPLLLMGAVVTGLIEEAAFRGYMQVPLEERYSPEVAIGIVAVIFAIAHLPSPLALMGLILGGVGWGVLAYLTDSILPGIVFHTVANAVIWIWAWGDRASLERILTSGVLQDSPDLSFVAVFGLTIILGVAAFGAFGKLAKVRDAATGLGNGAA